MWLIANGAMCGTGSMMKRMTTFCVDKCVTDCSFSVTIVPSPCEESNKDGYIVFYRQLE